MSPRYKITYEYCGKYFTGWQRLTYDLEKLPVQNVLENSLQKIFNKEIKIVGSSRTDTGVSALANTSHFDVDDERISKNGKSLPLLSEDELTIAINYNVGKEYKDRVRIIKTEMVDDMFHSRFHATSRTYLYKILANCGKKQTPLELLEKVLRVDFVLDIEKMKDAAQVFIGQHDFTSFKSKDCTRNPIRTVEYIKIIKLPNPELFHYHPDFIQISKESHKSNNNGLQYIGIEVKARSFLHNQVRIMVSSLIEVGKGRLTKEKLQDIMDKKDRQLAPQTIAGEPLTLLKVSYDDDDGDINSNNNQNNNNIFNNIKNNIIKLYNKIINK